MEMIVPDSKVLSRVRASRALQSFTLVRASKTFSTTASTLASSVKGDKDKRLERRHRFAVTRFAIGIGERNHHAAPGHRFGVHIIINLSVVGVVAQQRLAKSFVAHLLIFDRKRIDAVGIGAE